MWMANLSPDVTDAWHYLMSQGPGYVLAAGSLYLWWNLVKHQRETIDMFVSFGERRGAQESAILRMLEALTSEMRELRRDFGHLSICPVSQLSALDLAEARGPDHPSVHRMAAAIREAITLHEVAHGMTNAKTDPTKAGK